MKRILLLLLLTATSTFAQVGIGTTTPQGSLDITSTTDGLLIPRVALVNTTTSTVTTPTVSEMVYNTATSGDVTPGFYYWDGAKWIQQGNKSYTTTYTQTTITPVITSTTTYTPINGLSTISFTAPYSGNYQFVFLGYLGGNSLVTAGNPNIGVTEGNFKLTINGVDSIKYLHSESFDTGGSTGKYLQLFNEVTIIYNVTLTSGNTYTLSASFDGVNSNNLTSPESVVGNTGALSNLCSINITYTGK